jgi:hypothetical protein
VATAIPVVVGSTIRGAAAIPVVAVIQAAVNTIPVGAATTMDARAIPVDVGTMAAVEFTPTIAAIMAGVLTMVADEFTLAREHTSVVIMAADATTALAEYSWASTGSLMDTSMSRGTALQMAITTKQDTGTNYWAATTMGTPLRMFTLIRTATES